MSAFQGNQVYASHRVNNFSKEIDIEATEAVINHDTGLDQEVDDINERLSEEDLLMDQQFNVVTEPTPCIKVTNEYVDTDQSENSNGQFPNDNVPFGPI